MLTPARLHTTPPAQERPVPITAIANRGSNQESLETPRNGAGGYWRQQYIARS